MRRDHANWYRHLVDIGIALSAERNHARLLERILLEAKALSQADGGTLYLVNEDETGLRFEILRNDTLGIAMGGTTGKPIPFPPLPFTRPDGSRNESNIATYAALTGEVINIADAYDAEGFDFSGTRRFDASTGYRSKSFLTLPLRNHEATVIGVLQLINATASDGGIVPFDRDIQHLLEALASFAAIAITNEQLLTAQKTLFTAFIQVVAQAVDAKSPYTGGHCQRVPVIARLLAEAACAETEGPLAAFTLDDDQWYELEVAAGLHDCGKVTTPEYVVDKATKLETIHDRIHLIETRFLVLKREAEIACLESRLAGMPVAEAEARLAQTLVDLDADFAFLEHINQGGEFMAPDKLERLNRIAARPWRAADGGTCPLLSADEVYNLAIPRGTLTAEERQIINDHIVQTIRMLERLPFPKAMAHVVEIAGGHHEKMDGTGYPNRLTGERLSIQARILAIADIFEALTAADRPYKAGKTLSESLKIMVFMVKDRHIDPDLFALMLRAQVFQTYAEQHMKPEQIDTVDVAEFLAKVQALRPAPIAP